MLFTHRLEQTTTNDTNRNCDYQAIVNRKIDLATAGLPFFIFKDITRNVSPENALNIVEYVLAMKIETNISDSYRMSTINTLSLFSKFSKNKPFTQMSREDVLLYLDSSRKDETLDPLHNQYQAELERLKARLTNEKSEQDAQRDYEYEARKRLYQQCEPLIFKLIETSETALKHIKSMAARAKATDRQIFDEEYYLKTTRYYLLLPCAVFKMISKKLTLLDFQVDEMIYTQYILAKALYLSSTQDFEFATGEIRLQSICR